MSATETEETLESNVDAEKAESDAADATEVSENIAAEQTEDITMSPPDRVEELFDLATKSLARLDEAAETVKALAQSQQQAVEQSGELAPAFKKTMEEAAAEALESGGDALKKQVEEAASETVSALQASVASTQENVQQMEAGTAKFAAQIWRNALLASLAGAGVGLLAMLLAAWLMTWWVRADVDAMREERRDLAAEIRNLRETADEWAAKYGRAEVSNCAVPGEGERPCVRIDDRAGNFRGEKGEHYRVLWGY